MTNYDRIRYETEEDYLERRARQMTGKTKEMCPNKEDIFAMDMNQHNAGIFKVEDLANKFETSGQITIIPDEDIKSEPFTISSFETKIVEDPHILKVDKTEVHESGAKRSSRKGKGRYDLISPIALRRLARLYENGCEHFGEWNWEQGQRFSLLMDSALRHLNNYREGMRDEDHLTQAAWNIFAMIHFDEARPEFNDLPKFSDKDGKYNG